MTETCRVSVRELVAFSYFDPDIRPQASAMESMRQGALAHKACQRELEAECEKTVQHLFSLEGEDVLVYGRMDAYTDGDVPFVDEIKLGSGQETQADPAHRAQALCYAAMIAAEKGCAEVVFQVRYVSLGGETLHTFIQRLSATELQTEAEALLRPWLAAEKRERAHRQRRDESLRAMAFPFPEYRKGQRELAVQVYTAIGRKKRLFASLPTGTGKSAAVLYPALKAMGEGLTGKLLYLTSRNTARQSPLNTLKRMLDNGMQARISVLSAREKLCLYEVHCLSCPCAKGHYLRQAQAVEQLLTSGQNLWTDEFILSLARQWQLCPFELALALTELADVSLMDLNYAFDPFAQVKRLFQKRRDMTLLVDEAHHTADRVRESLSGELDGRKLCQLRTEIGKKVGRKHSLYRALTELIHRLRDLPEQLERLPESLLSLVERVQEEASQALSSQCGGEALGLLRLCLPVLYAAAHWDEDDALLMEQQGRERRVILYCLLPGKEIARITRGLRGTVFFSATLRPLPVMRQLLGGSEEDACFALPSPFPPERLAVVHRPINTRYAYREQTAQQVAEAIGEMAAARPGKHIAFFPSYAYLKLVQTYLEGYNLRLLVQEKEMDEKAREAFLNAFEQGEEPCLGLCVLGGLFSEGIDLPGKRLIGVAIAGVGLPTPSLRGEALRQCYQQRFGDGFGYACRIPGMHKVLQAAGRVIRSEKDKGMVLLLDDRYSQPEYRSLLPEEWQITHESIAQAAQRLEELE